MYKIKQFFKRIYNLYRWFPIIWEDQDWDHYYIFEILKFKLKNQAEYIGGYDRHLRAKRDAEVMMTCVRLIDKIQNDEYFKEYYSYHTLESTFTPSEEFLGMQEWDVIQTSEHFDDYFKKYPLIYRLVPDLKAPKDEIAMKIARINEERARKLLFKILENNIEKWWD
jgi:hypothetical protein